MITANRDRRLEITTFHEIVDRLAHLSPFTITEPADARGQSLKVNSIARETQPAIQCAIIGKHLQRKIVSIANVLRIAGQRHPAKRSFAFAEKRANVFRHKARYLKRIRTTSIESLLTN